MCMLNCPYCFISAGQGAGEARTGRLGQVGQERGNREAGAGGPGKGDREAAKLSGNSIYAPIGNISSKKNQLV